MAFKHPSEVSYLQARNSGFRGLNRASTMSIPGLAPARRDLTAELEHEAAAATVLNTGSALRVFARVRPEQPGDYLGDEREQVVEMPNQIHLLMHAPKDSATCRNANNGSGKILHRYTFTRLFRPETTQKQLFQQTTLNHITEFVNGQSCLLFTYGATNSGKTFTVQGTVQDPGLIPRSLDVLFNSIGHQLYGRADIQPHAHSDVVKVSQREEQAALRLRRETLQLGAEEPIGLTSSVSEDSLASSAFSLAGSISDLRCGEVENRQRDTQTVSISNHPNARFSVWISYVEVYNERMFDLLEPPSTSRDRTGLHLGLDKKGNTYVKGLRQVQVTSADEAYLVVRAGRHNLRFASNKLNHNSSRSHCVLNVKLIRMLDAENPSVARISMLSICDLAGSERVEKTEAQGQRMREAGNINTSLMVLGRCIKTIRHNQCRTGGATAGGGPAGPVGPTTRSSGVALVPYRDSKLTRLFQTFLSGATASRVTMVVNISPSPVVFDETIQVLKFSALAKQVSVQQPEKRRPPTRFSIMARRSVQKVGGVVGRPCPLLMDTAAEENEHKRLRGLVESLQAEVVELRRQNTDMEDNIRAEICTEFEQHLVTIQEKHELSLQNMMRRKDQEAALQIQEVARGLQAEFANKLRRSDGDSDGDSDSDTDGEHDERVDDLRAEIKSLEERATAAEQRSHLLEQQLEAESDDRAQAAQRFQEQREEIIEISGKLAEATATIANMKTELAAAEERCRRQVNASADDPVAKQLAERLEQLQQEMKFKEMDLQEAQDLLQEGSREFIEMQNERDDWQVRAGRLAAQLTGAEDAARDQLAQYDDLEQVVAAKTERIAQLERQLQQLTENAQVTAQQTHAAIPEEEDEDRMEAEAERQNDEKPADMSFASRLRSLRNKTGSVLKQVADSSPGGSLLELHAKVKKLETEVDDLKKSEAKLLKEKHLHEEKMSTMERDLNLASDESEGLLRTNQKLTSHIATQERVMAELSSRYMAAATPGVRSVARPSPLARTLSPQKRSAPADLNNTCGFEQAEREILEEERRNCPQERRELPHITVVKSTPSSATGSPTKEPSLEDSAAEEPACGGSAVAADDVQALRDELTRERTRLADLQTEHDALQTRLQAEVSATADALKQHCDAANAAAELTRRSDELQTQVEQLREQVEKLETAERELAALRAEKVSWEEERSADAEQRARVTAERAGLTQQLETVRAERDEMENTRQRLEARLETAHSELRSERERAEQERVDARSRLEAAAGAGGGDRRLSDALREATALQRDYKQTLLERNEARADLAVVERQLRELGAQLTAAAAAPDPALTERLRQRDTEVQVLQARVTALSREEDAFNILKAELEAKKQELRDCNVMELRAQLERADAERGHLRDELERRSNELLKLNIQLNSLKQKVTEKEEDVQKVREERVAMLSRSEADIRRKNDELNRERHESAHLREMMARLTPKSNTSLAQDLEAARAECRRKEEKIGRLEALLASEKPEVAAVPTPSHGRPTRAAATSAANYTDTRYSEAAIVVEEDNEEGEVTPMVVKKRARSTRKSARRRNTRATTTTDVEADANDTDDFEPPPSKSRLRSRRTTKASSSTASVHFADENEDPDSVSETGSSVSRGGRRRGVDGGATSGPEAAPPSVEVLTERPVTPSLPAPPQPATKSTSKRRLFKRVSNEILECSPIVEAPVAAVSPRKVTRQLTRALRSRRK